MTDTPFLADTVKTYGEEFMEKFPKPLGRVGRPEEQARCCLPEQRRRQLRLGQLLWTDGGYSGGVITGRIPT